MIKNTLIIFFLATTISFGQKLNELGVQFRYSGNNYVINQKTGVSEESDATERSKFYTLFFTHYLKNNNRFSWSCGIGGMNEKMKFFPMVHFKDIPTLNDLNSDTLIVAQIDNEEWQITVPFEFSYKLFNFPTKSYPMELLSGIRINVGIENKFTYKRTTDNFILDSYDEVKGMGFEYYNKDVNKRVSDYFSGNINRYKMMANAGIEFFEDLQNYGLSTGLRVNHYLISPVKSSIDNKFSFSFYMSMYFIF